MSLVGGPGLGFTPSATARVGCQVCWHLCPGKTCTCNIGVAPQHTSGVALPGLVAGVHLQIGCLLGGWVTRIPPLPKPLLCAEHHWYVPVTCIVLQVVQKMCRTAFRRRLLLQGASLRLLLPWRWRSWAWVHLPAGSTGAFCCRCVLILGLGLGPIEQRRSRHCVFTASCSVLDFLGV